jgi:hypothetical protein
MPNYDLQHYFLKERPKPEQITKQNTCTNKYPGRSCRDKKLSFQTLHTPENTG